MPEQALYLKWRPLTFDEVVGQEHVTRTLRNSLKTGRIRHAYLFSGPRGTGKTTSARLLAKAVNCLNDDPDQRPCNECATCVAVNEGRFLDLIEIDAASHTGVDDVRELRDRIAFAPSEGRYKVYIIDEVHRFSGNAFDALLKTLEEPPDHALFVLATTEIDRVPATIKSRCLPFEFRRLSLREVTERLQLIANEEGLQIEPAVLELVAREGTGSVRDSISLLDQIVADPEEAVTLELAQRILGTASARAVRELVTALLQQNISLGLHIINQAIDDGSDPRQFGQQVVEHLRSILMAQTASADLLQVSQDDKQLFHQQAQQISRSALLTAIRAFNKAVNEYAGGWQPQLELELALIESLQHVEPAPVQAAAPVAASLPPQPQQAAAPSQPQQPESPPEKKPEPPAIKTSGEPAAVSVTVVREKWGDLRRTILSHNPNLPHMLDPKFVQVLAVDGNRVIMGVENAMFLRKITEEERIDLIERGLEAVHGSRLRVEFILYDADNPPSSSPLDDDPVVNKLKGMGYEVKDDPNNML